jgi:L-ribulokinase
MQSLADIMQKPIKIVASDQACALGAAMFGAVASGYYSNIAEAVDNMNSGFDAGYMPIQENVTAYNKKYAAYLKAAQAVEFFTR